MDNCTIIWGVQQMMHNLESIKHKALEAYLPYKVPTDMMAQLSGVFGRKV